MKKNDENQNNDSGMTRRVYKKASLDDTVVNVRKDPSDDFDLLSDDGMMDYVPGVDDVDHFDFDEKDIEHYRKVNEQEAAERDRRRKQRALEKQRTAQKQQCETKKSDEQPQEKRQNKQAAKAVADEVSVKKTNTKKKKRRRRKDEETDIDDIELRRELSEKKRTNKEIMRITYVMMLLFFGMIGYFIYFDGVTSKEVIIRITAVWPRWRTVLSEERFFQRTEKFWQNPSGMTMAIITVIIRMDVHLPMWWEQVM